MATHTWWITRVNSLRFSYTGFARTLRFNRSNTWLIGSKFRLFAGHLSLCTLFLQAFLVCFYPRDMMCNPVSTTYRDWHEEEEPTEWLYFDALSQLCFTWIVTLGVFVYMKTLERVLLCLFSPYLMFFTIDNQQGILSNQIRQLPCRTPGARAHWLN